MRCVTQIQAIYLDALSSALPVPEPSISEVRNELQVLLASRAFRQSRGLAKLLRYICSKAMVDDADTITEYTIAVDVLGKPQDFKESKDASVRVEVHRLRKRLAEYYEQEGAHDSVRIVIPTGQYTPRFLVCDHPEAQNGVNREPILEDQGSVAPVPLETAPQPELQPARSNMLFARKQLWAFCGLAAVLAVVLVLVVTR